MNKKLRPVNVKALNSNMFHLLDDHWMLLTAGNSKGFNTMTASWGSFGILWNKPVAFGFIRPQRYTYGFANAEDIFTLSFFSEEYKNVLEYCGAHSGRDYDKIEHTGLTPVFSERGGIYFSQSDLVFECRKLYVDDLQSDKFIDKNLIQKIYPNEDYHRMFIGEILNCLAGELYISEKGIKFAAPETDIETDF